MLPGSTCAGTRTVEAANETVQTPPAGRSGTASVRASVGGIRTWPTTRPPSVAVMVWSASNSCPSVWSDTVTVPPVQGPSDEEGAASKKPGDIGALIASLPADGKESAAASPAPAPAVTPAPVAPESKPATATPAPIVSLPPAAVPKAASAPAPAASGGAYFLQAGAYKQSADAESARARILLLGLKAVVQRAEVNGAQWYRVRVGPYAKLDDMNRARVKLADNKIQSTIVRQ